MTSDARTPAKQLSWVEDDLTKMAFDEMNLVELPFALLTDARDVHTTPVRHLPLSDGDNEKLVTTESSLPTALAERVVLGLLWMTQARNGFASPTVRFSLRQLIHEFMYPGRSPRNRVSGAFFKRVEEEIHRIAHTRIVSNRWYDKRLLRTTKMDAAIIDYVQVIDDGGRNRPRVLEIRWGDKLFKSVRDRYTKSIDVHTVLQIDRPIDLRFYRWLDRQLATKPREVVASCQGFAKYKLLMRGQKINRGGRTASSYIVRKLKESLDRLDSLGFSVRMIADESKPDYRLEFERIDASRPNETVQIDHAADLVRRFQTLAHKLPAGAKKRTVSKAERAEAERWLEEYGVEAAGRLLERCVALHGCSGHKDRPLYSFKGLAFYEAKAYADLQTLQNTDSDADLKRLEVRAHEAWEAYKEQQLAAARSAWTPAALAALGDAVKREILAEYAGRAIKPSGFMLQQMVKLEMDIRILHESGSMSEEQFLAQWMRTHAPAETPINADSSSNAASHT